MNRSPHPVTSFISLGVLLVLTVAAIVLFSWLLLLGAITGLCLYAFVGIRQWFMAKGQAPQTKAPQGRIIEHDDTRPPF